MTARPPSDETEHSAIDPETCTPTPDVQGSAPRSLSEARRLAIQQADNAPAAHHAAQDDARLQQEPCSSCRGHLADDCGHHSWRGLMALLDEHWPEDIFPTSYPDDITRAAGARIVSLIRWADRMHAERDQARAQVQRVRELDPVEVALGGLAYVIDQIDDPEHTAGGLS